MNLRFSPLGKCESEKIWNQLQKLNWSRAEVRRRTGLDMALITRFFNYRSASLFTGARIATAIAAGMSERYQQWAQ